MNKSGRKWRIVIGVGLFALFIICFPFAYLAFQANQLRKTVRQIESMDGTVYFSHQIRKGNGDGAISGTHPDANLFFRQVMGDDAFSEISRVILKSQTRQTDLRILADLEKLESVTLLDDVVNDQSLRDLSECKRPIKLGLADASLSATGLAHLKGMNTPYLELHNCSALTAKEVSEISKFISLEHLVIMKTKISGGLEHLKELKNLRILVVGGAGISDQGLRSLEGFKHLETLAFYDHSSDPASTQQKTPLREGLSHLAKLPKLRKLVLRGYSLNDEVVASLGALTQLEEMDLTFSPITNEQLPSFAGLSHLKRLNTSGPVSEAAVQKLHEQIPDCEIVLFGDDGGSEFHIRPDHWGTGESRK